MRASSLYYELFLFHLINVCFSVDVLCRCRDHIDSKTILKISCFFILYSCVCMIWLRNVIVSTLIFYYLFLKPSLIFIFMKSSCVILLLERIITSYNRDDPLSVICSNVLKNMTIGLFI